MDRRVRQIAGILTVLLLTVAGMAGIMQGIRADDIATNEPVNPRDPTESARNRFRIFQECRWERGPILSVDGQVLAESVPFPEGENCRYERRYPSGDLAAHVVGRWSLFFGKMGLESVYNDVLVGPEVPPESVAEIFTKRPREGLTLHSTIDSRLQRTAVEALDGRRGGVVAMNPKTGGVLVAASVPSFDPNPLASLDRGVALRAHCELGVGVQREPDGGPVTDDEGNEVPCENPASPLLSVALRAHRPPGSSFKVVTAAAALESGEFTPSTGTYSGSAYTPPGATQAIHNYGGGSCGGSLANAIRVSCNVSMAKVAVDVGADQFLATAHAMGLDQFAGGNLQGCDAGPAPVDLRETFTGCLPSVVERPDGRDEPLEAAAFRALAGFGQGPIQVSPFGMALVTGTIANGGFVPKPRFANRATDRTGETVREIRSGVGAQVLSPEHAEQLQDMMRGVVTGGTASGAMGGFRIPSAGKTGTADQTACSADEQQIFPTACRSPGSYPHTWYISFAPVDDPQIVVVALVERGGEVRSGTGGRVAAPVARAVLEEFFRLYPTVEDDG